MTSNTSPSGCLRQPDRHERFHILPSIAPDFDLLGQGLPDLVVDFQRLFGVPTEEIFRQIASENAAMRRCRLVSPYREHFQSRAMFYLQRIALP